MRISIVAPIFEPLGGAQPYGPHALLVDLARGMQDRGHDVVVHCAAGSDVPGLRLRPVATPPDGADSRLQVGRPAASRPWVLDAFRRLYDDIRAFQPDSVSQHAFDAEAIVLAEGLPVLHTLHLAPILEEVVDAARASSGRFVTVSEAARHAWIAAGLRGVGVIRNGVPTGQPSSEIDPIALIAGRISPEKGVATAIRVGHRAGLRPVVVGSIYDEDYHRRDVLPLMHLAEHLPTIPRHVLSAMMARATVLLMPVGSGETFGLVAAEAQMVGCPVVGYRHGALPEVVEQGIGGFLVDPGDEDALVAAIHAARRLDRGRVRERAKEQLGLEATLDGYERELVAISAGRPTPAPAPPRAPVPSRDRGGRTTTPRSAHQDRG